MDFCSKVNFNSSGWIFPTWILLSFSYRAHSSEGPEPAYHEVVSGYEVFKYRNGPFRLKHNNKTLEEYQLAYETWGQLNAKKNNAILIFTGLSASSHAKSHEVGGDLVSRVDN